ncbi:MAG: UDP-N-acetylglucosamine 2-epimerase (non-hydrolyzing) [Rickettsiaceae bacterium]|nr:MAG: UDP-N-acetylglucosamine 2-epimerase (non-hydrolyzing) [Rickettsiaceae bacterium]
MLKVMTIVGTRPELIKMSRVIVELDKHTHHILVHTGQNFDYQLNQIFFDELNIRKPDYFLAAAGKTAAQTIAQVIEKSDEVFEKENPDALLLYGDTNSCLAVIAAKKRKIPIFHMEAGNRCFDQRVPEELNRKIIDHSSDINLVLTEHARRYLIAEGFPQERIIKTGSHMQEVLEYYMQQIKASNILNELNLKAENYFVVSAHREENVDDDTNLKHLIESLNAIANKYKMPVIVSTHPRTRSRLEKLKLNNIDNRIQFLQPLGFFSYIMLQMSAFCVLSDSGTLTEEAALLNLPAIAIRNSHERPEGMDAGVLIMCGLIKKDILTAIEIVSHRTSENKIISSVDDYKTELVSKKILNIILSYSSYINRVVWSKVV